MDFEVKTRVRQGCALSPLMFNCFMDRIVREAMEMTGGGLHVEYTTRGGLFLSYRDKTPLTTCIQNAQYADDLTLVAENRKGLQQMLVALDRACTRWGISGDKTPVVRAPAEDTRPSATEATAAVQTERKEEAARRDLLRWVDVISSKLTEIPQWQELVTDRSASKYYPPAQVNPILIHNEGSCRVLHVQ